MLGVKWFGEGWGGVGGSRRSNVRCSFLFIVFLYNENLFRQCKTTVNSLGLGDGLERWLFPLLGMNYVLGRTSLTAACVSGADRPVCPPPGPSPLLCPFRTRQGCWGTRQGCRGKGRGVGDETGVYRGRQGCRRRGRGVRRRGRGADVAGTRHECRGEGRV